MKINKTMVYKDIVYQIKSIGGTFVEVFKDTKSIAKVMGEEEARRVIWLELVELGNDIEYVSEDMFR